MGRKMGKMILVTGGARSGKSSFAEGLAKSYGENVLYIATSVPFDDEMKQRIKKHREQRPGFWETLEAYKDLDRHLDGRIDTKCAVMLDCITVMTSNLMLEKCSDIENISNKEALEIEDYIKSQINALISAAKKFQGPFIIVTNEVGMGIVPEYKSGRVFRDIAGRVNQILAGECDEVFLCVSGISVKIKG